MLCVDTAKAVQAPVADYALLLEDAPLEFRDQLLHILYDGGLDGALTHSLTML